MKRWRHAPVMMLQARYRLHLAPTVPYDGFWRVDAYCDIPFLYKVRLVWGKCGMVFGLESLLLHVLGLYGPIPPLVAGHACDALAVMFGKGAPLDVQSTCPHVYLQNFCTVVVC